MAGLTLSDAETGLANALSAMTKAVNSQGYSHSGAQVSISKQNQSIGQLQSNVDFWQNWVDKLSNNQRGVIISQVAPE